MTAKSEPAEEPRMLLCENKLNFILWEETGDSFHSSRTWKCQALRKQGSSAVVTMLPFTVKTKVYTRRHRTQKYGRENFSVTIGYISCGMHISKYTYQEP